MAPARFSASFAIGIIRGDACAALVLEAEAPGAAEDAEDGRREAAVALRAVLALLEDELLAAPDGARASPCRQEGIIWR